MDWFCLSVCSHATHIVLSWFHISFDRGCDAFGYVRQSKASPPNIHQRFTLFIGLFVTGVSPGGGASNIWTLMLGGNLVSFPRLFLTRIQSKGCLHISYSPEFVNNDDDCVHICCLFHDAPVDIFPRKAGFPRGQY